ncbi:uncharacterized protein EV420DRAFT_1501589 [Desarmillaria tabescens]|uniref:MARVEL domain-containing protein n=1 Tax=Armillaria tabescens TaxID=1929756 RepID=A0AA39TRF1_ARMTA|nr:uncharacterized protein EV420DRAFT_1501589 [Desarmillaria tabescens]KAK0467847.1 hypothetical protein EV420DRAFT_1501589 [Desarmillaria tabescens]
MSVITILRLTALVATLVFSVIILGLSAHITYLTTTVYGAYFTFAAMSIATACLTILTLPVMIAIDITRKGAFTSMVVVELSWLGVLWVLWLTSAALTADANTKTFVSGCGYINTEIDQACKEFNAIEAFGFLNWLILLGYTITLIVFAIIAANRGNNGVWTSSSTATDFFARGPGAYSGANTVAPEKVNYAPAQPQPSVVQYPPQSPSAYSAQQPQHTQQSSYPQV